MTRPNSRNLPPLASRRRIVFVLTTVSALTGAVQGAPSFAQRKSILGKVRKSPLGSRVVGGSSFEAPQDGDVDGRALLVPDAPNDKMQLKTIDSQKEEDHNTPERSFKEDIPFWPCMDDLDQRLINISLPVIANFAIAPLVGAIDLFFINRMGNALAVAGQAAANQVYGSLFWLTSFLPSITAIEVSKASTRGDQEGVQEAICTAIFVGVIFSLIGSAGMLSFPGKALQSVLKNEAPAMEFAKPYLKIRGLSFLPSVISFVGFSAFRGQLDTTTPVQISLFSNLFHALLVPIFVFTLSMGVSGAALATLISEIISAVTYLVLMNHRKLINASKMLRLPDFSKLLDLIKGGMALQLRNVAFNLTFIFVTRITQSIDNTGVASAAHAMALQTFQVGGIFLLALSVVAQTVVPGAMIEKFDESQKRVVGGISHAKSVVNRLMSWGLILGIVLGSLQVLMLPFILKSSPLQEVRDAARIPAYLASVMQVVNGILFIGEGVMVGTGDFLQLSLSTAVAALGCIGAMKVLSSRFGLTGVWLSFAVFNGVRLFFVWMHQFYTGPLASRKQFPSNADSFSPIEQT